MFTVSVQKAQAIKVNWRFYILARLEKSRPQRDKALMAPVGVWHRKSFPHEAVPARCSVPSPRSRYCRPRLPAQPCLGNLAARRPSSPDHPSPRPCAALTHQHPVTLTEGPQTRRQGPFCEETGDLGCPRVSI